MLQSWYRESLFSCWVSFKMTSILCFFLDEWWDLDDFSLYWQEDADYLVTDDDNVRNKENLLELQLLSTPSLLLHLYRKKKVSKQKFHSGLDKLHEIGWFSPVVLDEIARRGKIEETNRYSSR